MCSPRPKGARQLVSVIVPAVAAEGAQVDHDGGPWLSQRKLHKRRRNMAPLPAMVVREELTDLTGRCFNCLGEDHVAALCPNPTKFLRCGGEGHKARLCRSRSSPSGGPTLSGGGPSVTVRLGPRVEVDPRAAAVPGMVAAPARFPPLDWWLRRLPLAWPARRLHPARPAA